MGFSELVFRVVYWGFAAVYGGILWAAIGAGFFIIFAVPLINNETLESSTSNAKFLVCAVLLFLGGPYVWYLLAQTYLKTKKQGG